MDSSSPAVVKQQALTSLDRPFVVCVLTDDSCASAAVTIARAAYAGADAFELNLPLLALEAGEAVRALVNSCGRPLYTSCRRAAFMRVYGRGDVPNWSDDERMERQMELIAAGSVAIDIELDTFAEEPNRGLALSRDAVARQAAIIEAVHARGAEVILSCHTRDTLTRSAIKEIAHVASARGADLVKIVCPVTSHHEALEVIAAAIDMRHMISVPATVIGMGRMGRYTRILSPVLAASWALCQQEFAVGGFSEQPLVKDAREALRVLSALEAFP